MESYALAIAREALFLVLILAAPPVVSAMVIGLIVSLIQATTQVQEQTLTFVPKMVTVTLVLIVFGPFGMAQMISFTRALMLAFPEYVGS